MTTMTTEETRALLGKEQLDAAFPIAEANAHARAAIEHAAQAGGETLLRFLMRYTSWNGLFGAGVATLSGKVGRSQGLFLDPEETVPYVADRSVYIASFLFDAARDEFDDSATDHRDTHRCLAQATLKGAIDVLGIDVSSPEWAEMPLWLEAVRGRVATGYGAASADSRDAMFRAMGYHLGSEVLADAEFSMIDQALRRHQPDFVTALENRTVRIVKKDHNAYYWVAIHSGHGGGVEADHFKWAVRGVRVALRYTPEKRRERAREAIYDGFRAFGADHHLFFRHVNDA
ncbi:MAG: hypothetical protein EP330_16920 [Deltaproteobacteria bacterium]|nr:MAG: hypothetical protein EP330_16920 [Deltaproteobacteria bacterium]